MRVVLKPMGVGVLVVAVVLLAAMAMFRPFQRTGVYAPSQTSGTARSLITGGDFKEQPGSNWYAAGAVFSVERDSSATGQSRHYLKVVVPKAPGAPWQATIGCHVDAALRAGQPLSLHLSIRSRTHFRVTVVHQEATSPFQKSFIEEVSVSPEWHEYSFSGKSISDFAAGTSQIEVYVGSAQGVVEIADVRFETDAR